MYRLRDKDTGLYYAGGIYGRFSKNGKVYHSLTNLKLALQGYLPHVARTKLYRQNNYQFKTEEFNTLLEKFKKQWIESPESFIPDNWELIELGEEGWKIIPISSVFPIYKSKKSNVW